jgi:condensin complex subunit 3
LNVPVDNATLDVFLSRTRDTDPVTRKLVYSVLQSKLAHPRQLSIAQRELIIKDGLGDREPAVRLAAGKLVASWFDKVLSEATIPEDETWTGDDGGIMRGFVAFLGLFDVVGPGESIAVDAILSIFVTRPELADAFIFQGKYRSILQVNALTWLQRPIGKS